MPLLPKEIDFQPETLFALPVESHPWWVAHVRSRQEKVLARHLASNGVPFYLPLVESRQRRAGRMLRSFRPLFPGYVFFRGDDAREVVFKTRTLANLIDVPDQDRFGSELAQIRDLQVAGASFRVLEELVAGDPVRITNGPLRGYSGIIADERSRNRMIVQLSLLRQSVLVEVDRDVLRRVPAAEAALPPRRRV